MAARQLTAQTNTLFFDSLNGESVKAILRHEEELVAIIEQENLECDIEPTDICPEDVEKAVNELVENIEYDKTNEFGESVEDGTTNKTQAKVPSYCLECIHFKRVTDIKDIKRGDSIRFPRSFGLYDHHAIVKEVEPITRGNSKCRLVLIHLRKDKFPAQVTVKEETKEFDLKRDHIESIVDRDQTFSPDEIIQRAERYAETYKHPSTYNIFKNNCEHVVNQISFGKKISKQVFTKSEKMLALINCVFELIYKIGVKAWGLPILGSLACVVSLSNIFRRLKGIGNLLKEKLLCQPCYNKKYKVLAVSLFFGIISLGASLIAHINFAALSLSLIAGIVLPIAAQYVAKYLMPLIQPAFNISKRLVTRPSMIHPGDIITYPYCWLSHEGIVTEISNRDGILDKINIRMVHFPWPGLFKPYTVTEEDIIFNLTEDDVFVLHFEGISCNEPENTVRQAREQVGKQNHSHFFYRSSHMTRYCKTGCKKLADIPKQKATDIEDISPGDVIQFSYKGLPHEAVVVKVGYAEKIDVGIIHYSYQGLFENRKVIEEKISVDLSTDKIFVHDYESENVYSADEVVRRARSRLDEERFNTLTNRSSHLAKWSKVKK